MNNRSNIITALLGVVLGVLVTLLTVNVISHKKKFDGDYNRWRKLNLILQEVGSNYVDTIELAYSGAQIIHPKTIKPLQQKNIPLYVRPFGNKHAAGSVITGDVERAYEPIMIQKSNQVLLKLHSRDLSFVLEEKFAKVFNTLDSHRIKTNLVHNSAVDLYMSVDASWHIDDAISEFEAEGFDVEKSEDVEMVTIRYYNEELYRKYAFDERIIIKQSTPHTLRFVRTK